MVRDCWELGVGRLFWKVFVNFEKFFAPMAYLNNCKTELGSEFRECFYQLWFEIREGIRDPRSNRTDGRWYSSEVRNLKKCWEHVSRLENKDSRIFFFRVETRERGFFEIFHWFETRDWNGSWSSCRSEKACHWLKLVGCPKQMSDVSAATCYPCALSPSADLLWHVSCCVQYVETHRSLFV